MILYAYKHCYGTYAIVLPLTYLRSLSIFQLSNPSLILSHCHDIYSQSLYYKMVSSIYTQMKLALTGHDAILEGLVRTSCRVQTILGSHHNLERFVEVHKFNQRHSKHWVLKSIGNFRSYTCLINLCIQLVFRTPEYFEYKSLTEYPFQLAIHGYIHTTCTNRSLVQICINTLVSKSIYSKKSAMTFYV